MWKIGTVPRPAPTAPVVFDLKQASAHLEYLAKNAKMSGMPVVITLP